MQAVIVVPEAEGKKPTLEYVQVRDPVAAPAELLVRVKAAGINRIDLARAHAHAAFDAGEPAVAGLEFAGEVVAMGSEARGFLPGDRVMAMSRAAYAELACVDHRLALKIPASMSWDQAVAIITVFATAHDALVTHGGYTPGKSVLVQGVTSAVGIAVLQIAKAMGASTVLGVARSEGKAAKLTALGLDHFINAGQPDLVEQVKAITQQRGVDIVIDMVGKGTLSASLQCAALDARIVSVGRMGGNRDEIDLDMLQLKRVTLAGVSFRQRSLDDKIILFRRFWQDLLPLFESGRLSPLIESVYPLRDALIAQEFMALNQHLGKVILRP